MNANLPPARSNATWAWLIADLSLDRARTLIAPLRIPVPDPDLFTTALQSLQPPLGIAEDVVPRVRQALGVALGPPTAERALAWMMTFPCDGDSVLPAPHYWRQHLEDAEADVPPPGVPQGPWSLLLATLRGRAATLDIAPSVAPLVETAARNRDESADLLARLRKLRGPPFTQFDLQVYMRFGWNDHGDIRGLTSIELGLMNAEIIAVWRALAPLFDSRVQAAMEAWAHAEDIALRDAALGDAAQVAAEAARLGVSPEELINDLMPPPADPPPLKDLLRA